ncbi:MAG: heme-copper oxidase subunit III [Actinomycetota bacterium]|nr:heme-copper oxidase subunit III [Actinomycetota bacterium]
MSETTAGAPSRGPVPHQRFPVALLGMVLFVAGEVMFFGALFAAYFTLRRRAGVWPPEGTPEIDVVLPAILTGVLLISSLTAHLAVGAYKKGNRGGLVRWLAATVLLGAVFLVGEGIEWARLIGEDFTISSNVYGTLFFTMTGFHGLHLLGGLIILLVGLRRATIAPLAHQRLASLEAATYYWHFVDVVWLGVGTSLYLLA